MSRVAKKPVELPQGVSATVSGNTVTVKGAKGSLSLALVEGVSVSADKQALTVNLAASAAHLRPTAGATRAHLANMVLGVSKGYEKKLELVGVGYRAAVAGKTLNLTLGFSHPVTYAVPEGITVETPSQTEIIVKGTSRQQVGQAAAEIRDFRPPEPYKGKGVRYAGERIELKEAKKK
jgi:large subunit ribosomal protein L6